VCSSSAAAARLLLLKGGTRVAASRAVKWGPSLVCDERAGGYVRSVQGTSPRSSRLVAPSKKYSEAVFSIGPSGSSPKGSPNIRR